MSMAEPYNPENIFAKILRGDIPAAVIAETDHTLAFMDAFPQSNGHCLIIPKVGATNILSIDPASLTAVITETQRVAKAVNAALSPDGIRVIQFNGAPAGQTVFHIHFHVIPMWEGRTLGGHGGTAAEMADLERLAGQIKAKL